MSLVIPFLPETTTDIIIIDGVQYRPPIIDSDGHLQVDVLSNPLPTDAATATNQATMITALQLIDDLRAALDAVRTDRLNVNVYRDGASEVKTARKRTVDNSTTRVTLITPTSGKKIRVTSVNVWTASATETTFEVYFGTGAEIATNFGSEIMDARLDTGVLNAFGMVWPDGGGPVGAADEVLSIRTDGNITILGSFLVVYREE